MLGRRVAHTLVRNIGLKTASKVFVDHMQPPAYSKDR